MATECQECKTVIRKKGIIISKCGARNNNCCIEKIDNVDKVKKKKLKKEVFKKSENNIFDGFDETYINEEEKSDE